MTSKKSNKSDTNSTPINTGNTTLALDGTSKPVTKPVIK